MEYKGLNGFFDFMNYARFGWVGGDDRYGKNQ